MSIEQTGQSLQFFAHYTLDGVSVGAGDITVTVDIYNPNGTKIVNNASANHFGGGVWTRYLDGTETGTANEYIAIFKTAGDVDQKHIPSLWVVGRGGVENLDAAVSTRATPAQVTTIVGAIAGGGGSTPHTLTIKDGDDDPLDGVSVTVRTSNNVGETPTATGSTDAFGNVTFQLDPGTYFAWCQQGRTNFNNPTEFEVTA